MYPGNTEREFGIHSDWDKKETLFSIIYCSKIGHFKIFHKALFGLLFTDKCGSRAYVIWRETSWTGHHSPIKSLPSWKEKSMLSFAFKWCFIESDYINSRSSRLGISCPYSPDLLSWESQKEDLIPNNVKAKLHCIKIMNFLSVKLPFKKIRLFIRIFTINLLYKPKGLLLKIYKRMQQPKI